jgi:DNA polymerase III, delta subunit
MIHFYYGEDSLSLKRKIDTATKSFSVKYGAENVSQIDATEANIDNVLSELVNIGLFSANRLIILRNVFANKYFCEKLEETLPRVADETEIVIVEPKPDRRTKLYKILTKNYKSKDFVLDKNVANFAMDEANSKKVEIDRSGIDELILYTGGDRWRIASEIEKFAAINKLVTRDLVHDNVEPELQASAFNLLDNLLAGRREKVFEELSKLRIQEDANKFFGLLSSQIYALAVAANSEEKTSSEAAKETGVHPFVLSKMLQATNRISKEDVKRYSKIISETDEKIKASKTDAWTLVELAISRF